MPLPQHVEPVPDTIDEVERLDLAQLALLLRERRGSLSQRQAAEKAGVSFSTFNRVEGGAQPDLASFTRLCAWLGQPPSRFFIPVAERQAAPLEDVIAHLTADPRLSAESSEMLIQTLKKLYAAVAIDLEAQSDEQVLAMHLRAQPVLRPGVPNRLSRMLTSMQSGLEELIDAGEL